MRRRALVALVFLVAGAVLAESWHAASNAAATGGRPWPWLWPATLEAFIFVLVLVYWDARSEGRKAPGARALLALTTAVAALVQALDAPRSWLGWTTAAWTPFALLLTVEFAVWLLYGAARVPEDFPEPVVPLTPDPAPAAPDTTPDTRPAAPVQPRRQRALTPDETRRVTPLAAQGLKAYTIARQTGIREPVVRQHLRDHTPASTNGSRP